LPLAHLLQGGRERDTAMIQERLNWKLFRRSLIKKLSPSEEELRRRKEEFRTLAGQLAELELTLNALRVDVGAFLYSAQAVVGERLLEQALLWRRLVGALLAIEPDNTEYQVRAKKAREDAEKAQQEHDGFFRGHGTSEIYGEFMNTNKSRLSDEVRKLYIKLVKLAHPDLTTDPEGKKRRNKFMQEVNTAYEAGDVERLEELYLEWGASQESLGGESMGDALARIARLISQVKDRMAVVEAEIAALMNTDEYEMFVAAKERGFEDYLNNLAATADSENDRLKAGIDQVSRRIEEILDPVLR